MNCLGIVTAFVPLIHPRKLFWVLKKNVLPVPIHEPGPSPGHVVRGLSANIGDGVLTSRVCGWHCELKVRRSLVARPPSAVYVTKNS